MSPQEARAPRGRYAGGAVWLGPEVLTAASDNDPTNVGTAVVVGAQTGYQLSWVALLVAPLLAVVLTIAAHVGIVARDEPLGIALVALLLAGRYDKVVGVLRYVLVGFLSFGAAAVLAGPDWVQVLRSSGRRCDSSHRYCGHSVVHADHVGSDFRRAP